MKSIFNDFFLMSCVFMKHVYWLKELDKTSLSIAGGKGANLGEMFNIPLPVPDAFIVGSDSYFEFIRVNKIDSMIRVELSILDVNDSQKLQETSKRIMDAIINGSVPDDMRAEIVKAYNKLCGVDLIPSLSQEVYVAVRSSATAEDLPGYSFAGQQATFLNVKGSEEVVKAVRKCWASLFEARAIYYRSINKFDHLKVGLAAVVQKMIQSEKSGVMFTANPVSSNENEIVIEAGYGLGEAIVSGSIIPDMYVVDKRDLSIISKAVYEQEEMIKKVGNQNEWMPVPESDKRLQKISDSEIIELAKFGKLIEEHYGFPQDIEWCVSEGKIYIVQARPITSLSKEKAGKTTETRDSSLKPFEEKKVIEMNKKEEEKEEVLVKGIPASPGIASGEVKIIFDAKELYKIKNGDIMVTRMTSPDFVPGMKRASAIVTDEGGMTAHAAIVSRELGIPCIVGTRDATKKLVEGQFVTVNAVQGIVVSGGSPKSETEEAPKSLPSHESDSPIVTGTKIYVNLAEPELAEEVSKRNADGVGLFRAEFLIAGLGVHPKKLIKEHREEEFISGIAKGMRKVCAAFYPRPVVYRATDFKTNEYRNLEGGEEFEPKEENPMIGYRGCFRYVKDPEVFKLELSAIKRVREQYGMKNLWLMIPFVRETAELKQVLELIKDSGLPRSKDFKVWIMVEVPSTVFIIEKFIELGIDGISIGSNDLTQLILGIDRDNPLVAEEFDERDDAVITALKRVIEACNKAGITSSICGQAPSNFPEFAEKLIELGVTSISVNPDVIEKTRRIVASAEKRLLLKSAREKTRFQEPLQ